MPAIQPVRLKTQSARLAEQFSDPRAFSRHFTLLLEEYADHTHRPGQAGEPSPLLPSFNTPPPVLRQVWLAILPLISFHPQAALNLCDALWSYPALEHRLLAADILGQMPVEHQAEVINRVQLWTSADIEDCLVEALLERSLVSMRLKSSQVVADLAEHWLSGGDAQQKQLGLRLLNFMASDSSFADLPVIFRLLTPFLRSAPRLYRPDIISLLNRLILRSAPEVAYLFHQSLAATDNPDTPWLLRQVIAGFPIELQAGLRDSMRKK